MRLRALALLPLFALAACSTSDEGPNDNDDDLGVPAENPNAADEPLPGKDLPAVVDEPGIPNDGGTGESGPTPSGGNCTLNGLYCGGDKVIGDSKTLYKCNGPGTPTVVQKCAAGCTVSSGRDDSCAAAPGACAIMVVPQATYLKYGLHPDASNALAYLNFTSGRITQTIGSAAASAGTHDQDGVAGGRPYSAATDLSISGLTDAQVAVLLDQLTAVGFIPYYRKPGFDGWPASEARHLHVVWAGAAMKRSLRDQARDWHVGKNGLASHTTYTFKTWTQCWRDSIWTRYLTANSATN